MTLTLKSSPVVLPYVSPSLPARLRACTHATHATHTSFFLLQTETKTNPQLDDPSYLALADSQAALDAITRRQTRALRAAERALGGLLQGDAAVHMAAHGGAAGAPGETPGIAFRLRRPTMNSASWLVSRTPSHGLRRSDMYIESSTKRVNARRVGAGVVWWVGALIGWLTLTPTSTHSTGSAAPHR